MVAHQFDPNMASDDQYEPGDLKHLVAGNRCRSLDSRRTPGQIVEINLAIGMFQWQILKFEDAGKTWNLPLENVVQFQFDMGSKKLPKSAINEFEKIVKHFDEPLIIHESNDVAQKTEHAISIETIAAKKWLKANSSFIQRGEKLNFGSIHGNPDLQENLLSYLSLNNFEEIERRTTTNYVLNPRSGEWFKGMEIAIAEMGLANYEGQIPRTKDIFEGVGSKDLRKHYILMRLAFVRAMFEVLGISEVVLFRGMSTEGKWLKKRRTTLSSWTFSKKIAESFARPTAPGQTRKSSMIERSVPIYNLFMTFLETKAMNHPYQEAEAVILER